MALDDYLDTTFTLYKKTFVQNSSKQSISTNVESGTYLFHARQTDLSPMEMKMFGISDRRSGAIKLWGPTEFFYENDDGDTVDTTVEVNDILTNEDDSGTEYDVLAVKMVKRGVENHHLEIVISPQVT